MKRSSSIVVLAVGFLVAAAQAHAVGWKEHRAAPELVGKDWHHTERPLSLANLKGKVVLVQFWTFGCINCKHNLPAYNQWQKEFGDKGLQIIGVHTPETKEERVGAKVDQAIAHWSISYPVLADNDSKNWNRWGVRFWPSIFVVDKHGRVRDVWEGELEYGGAGGTARITKEIKLLLAEN